MNEKEKAEMDRCKNDPVYFMEKHVRVKDSSGSVKPLEITEYQKEWLRSQLMNKDNQRRWIHHEKLYGFNAREKSYRRYNHRYEKRQARYSTAKKELVRLKSLRKSGKKLLKQLFRMGAPSAGVVMPHSDWKRDLLISRISSLKVPTLPLDLRNEISGSNAGPAIMSGNLGIAVRSNSLPPWQKLID